MNIDWPKRRLIFDRIACVPILITCDDYAVVHVNNKLGQKRIYCLIIIPRYYLQINILSKDEISMECLVSCYRV